MPTVDAWNICEESQTVLLSRLLRVPKIGRQSNTNLIEELAGKVSQLPISRLTGKVPFSRFNFSGYRVYQDPTTAGDSSSVLIFCENGQLVVIVLRVIISRERCQPRSFGNL
jgi:hypothetical protein